MKTRSLSAMKHNSAMAGLVLAAAMCTPVPLVSARQQPRDPSDDAVSQPLFTYAVRHDHAAGSGPGTFAITSKGFEYHGTGKDEVRHSHVWKSADIKQIEVGPTKIKLIVYEARSIPVLPRQLPFVKDTKAVPIGTEHAYEFKLTDSEVSQAAVRLVTDRFLRPIETSVLPSDPGTLGAPLFELPVFHKHRVGGESGILRVFDGRLVFAVDQADHSRVWRFIDIRSMSSLGRFGFEITTYESQLGPGGKDYVFDLKRPMTDDEYDTLWNKVYEARETPHAY